MKNNPVTLKNEYLGLLFDLEFNALVFAIADTLSKNNPSFTGTMTGGGIIDGGTF